ncbi:hypothetical protein [Nocardia sp. NPDC005998]|uniref:hypothetical protein n=1 Tax=Nocardia sp. NPDC005998 TaxID=3156894 RepID=UPI0033AF394F
MLGATGDVPGFVFRSLRRQARSFQREDWLWLRCTTFHAEAGDQLRHFVLPQLDG